MNSIEKITIDITNINIKIYQIMKKYLMGGIAAIALCAAFTSCSKGGDVYDPTAVQQMEEQKKKEALEKSIAQVNEQYAVAFEKAFGKVGSNVDWGFGSGKASTRTGSGEIIKPDMTSFPGHTTEREHQANYRTPEGYADIVAPVTTKEAAWVMDWFSKNPGLSKEGVDFHNFFVQNVGDNGHTKAGYFHSTEGGKPETVEAKTYEGIQMDKLMLGPVADTNNMIHGLDFNATSGFNEWNLFYVKGSSALQFAYHASYNSEYKYLFKCVQLTVPAECFDDNQPHTGWYVGFSYYALKQETNEKWHEIGIDRLQYADDWVLKIVPGEGEVSPTPTPTYRVIAEDLNAEEASDFDFNDVVFDVEPNEAGNAAKIVVRAAGGIYKLTVAGQEVHAAFGQNAKADGTYPMINTNPWDPNTKATLIESYPGEFGSDAEIRNTIKNIEIKVYKPSFEENGLVLTAQTGKPACKILVDQTFNVVKERTGIADENTNFHKYVQGIWDTETNGFWWKATK